MAKASPPTNFVYPMAKTWLSIPNWLAQRPISEIGHREKIVYGRLCQYAGQRDRCYPKVTTLATELGMSESGVKRALKELKDLGLVVSVQHGLQKSNTYFFLDHPWMHEVLADADFSHEDDPDLAKAAALVAGSQVSEKPVSSDLTLPDRSDLTLPEGSEVTLPIGREKDKRSEKEITPAAGAPGSDPSPKPPVVYRSRGPRKKSPKKFRRVAPESHRDEGLDPADRQTEFTDPRLEAKRAKVVAHRENPPEKPKRLSATSMLNYFEHLIHHHWNTSEDSQVSKFHPGIHTDQAFAEARGIINVFKVADISDESILESLRQFAIHEKPNANISAWRQWMTRYNYYVGRVQKMGSLATRDTSSVTKEDIDAYYEDQLSDD